MWTAEQLAAIKLRHAHLLVSAAAGSGKTAVLVERIIQLILNGETHVDRLLVVTYTNAAAGEMKERVEQAISRAMEKNEGDLTYLNEQMKRLPFARIKTFHSFCLEVIRQHFQLIDIDPQFRMMTETERYIIMDEAMEAVMENAYEDPSAQWVSLVESYSGNRDDRKVRSMVLELYHFCLSQTEPLNFMKVQEDVYSDPHHPLRLKWEEAMIEHFQMLLREGLDLIEEAISKCRQPMGPEPYIAALEADYTLLESLFHASKGIETLEVAVKNIVFQKIATIKKKDYDQYDVELIDEVKTRLRDKMIKKQIVAPIQAFFEYKSVKRYRDELGDQADLIQTLFEITQAFMQEYSRRKRLKNVMDFSDLEHFAIEILKNDEIAKLYQETFDYIFIDEYQDASEIQEFITQRIKSRNNVFRVGDVKQSIYKFRLADPELFLDKYHSYTHIEDLLPLRENVKAVDFQTLNEKLAKEDQENFIRIDLTSNFRSRPQMLDEVNQVFQEIMSPQLGDLQYDESAMLYGKMPFEETEKPYIEAYIVGKKELDEKGEDWVSDMGSDELEARTMAQKIKEVIGKPLYFPKEQKLRACAYRDIVVLLRSVKSWTPIFEQVFLEEGIPLYAASQTGYFDTLEVKWLLALLRIIDNPLQDLPFLVVLRSPVVGLTIEEMVRLKIETSSYPCFYYEKCLHYIEEADGEDKLSEKLKAFFVQLKEWKALSTYLSVDRLIWEVIHHTGLDEFIEAMPGGIARHANVRLLLDRAKELQKAKHFTLLHFIEFIDEMVKTHGDMGVATAIGEEEDVVRLMSIHKSKGLEFPVVFLGGLGKRFNLMDSLGPLTLHKAWGLGLHRVDLDLRVKSKTLPQMVLKNQMRRETLSEEMRVLYVGLTRAVDRMYVFATVSDALKKKEEWEKPLSHHTLYHAGSFADWLLPVWLKKDHVICHFESTQDRLLQERNLENQLLERYKILSDDAYDLDEQALKSQELIHQRLSFKPYKAHELFQPVKTSVSRLKASVFDEWMIRPVFLEEKTAPSALEKGNAYHKWLEHIDFSKCLTVEMAEDILEELLTKQLINAQFKNLLEVEKIMKFIRSDLGQRIQHSTFHRKETPFVYHEKGQLVQGIIDLYFEEDNQWVIVDYKTDLLKGKSVSQVAENYRLQLDYYGKALEALTGKKVKEKVIYLIMLDEVYILD